MYFVTQYKKMLQTEVKNPNDLYLFSYFSSFLYNGPFSKKLMKLKEALVTHIKEKFAK
jgi:hypothetical protein